MTAPDSAAIARLAQWRHSIRSFVWDNFGVRPDAWQDEGCEAWDRGDQRIAFKACKGPGKTAFLAWAGWHFLATRRRPKIAATSVTADNLSDNLWTEMAKWRNRSEFLRSRFTWQKTRIFSNECPEEWWMAARGWSKTADAQEQADTLAGLHADYILFLLDEMGSIPDAVIVAAEAALATGIESRLIGAGNPTQRSGPLWSACTKNKHLWTIITITGDPENSKRSPRISLEWAKSQIEQYGRDNPWVQANVFGEFPSASPLNFFDSDVIDAAMRREPLATMYDPMIFGVDVARYGDDRSVIAIRKGPDGRTHPPLEFRNLDTMQLASRVAEWSEKLHPDAIFVDGGGVGAGVIDRLRQLKIPALEVQFGANPDRGQNEKDPTAYRNRRAEMYGQLREWLKHGAIPESNDLRNELTPLQYAFCIYKGRDCVILEPKDEFKAREGFSPDLADAFALTFAYPVQANSHAGRAAARVMMPTHVTHEYDPLGSAEEYNRKVEQRTRSEYNPMEMN